MGRHDKTIYLHPGRNFVVFELENGEAAYCSGGFRLFMNEEAMVGLPSTFPVNADEIHALLGKANPTIANALCSRRIIELDLGVGAEPGRRLLSLVGL
ncbi:MULTISPECIES: hypothetical protein [unclassified Mesorhizobium]|uniref:hypothetical protein n=1 Tax=unclassified Mesorhizobium TaxID=325217 RepID=UPI00117DD4C0|nr:MULTISPECIES: hypothetical protein [unclassified Mesorhizobium]